MARRQKLVWCVATYPAPTPTNPDWVVRVFGGGVTYNWAKLDAKSNIGRTAAHHKRPIEGWTFAPYKMAKPRFKVGDKVRRIEFGKRAKVQTVLAVPDTPILDGSICVHTILGGCRVWEGEKLFELAT